MTTTFHVQVHTYSCGTKNGELEWTGNAVKHETFDDAKEAAEDLFSRWTAAKYWRVIDSNGVYRGSNLKQA